MYCILQTLSSLSSPFVFPINPSLQLLNAIVMVKKKVFRKRVKPQYFRNINVFNSPNNVSPKIIPS